MSGITFKHKGNFNNTERFLNNASRLRFDSIFENFGAEGVRELSKATPVDTGETANSWSYHVQRTYKGYILSWSNSKMAGQTPLVILLQYGHGTRGGTYVQGIDFINPALKPVMQNLADRLWKEVTSA